MKRNAKGIHASDKIVSITEHRRPLAVFHIPNIEADLLELKRFAGMSREERVEFQRKGGDPHAAALGILTAISAYYESLCSAYPRKGDRS